MEPETRGHEPADLAVAEEGGGLHFAFLTTFYPPQRVHLIDTTNGFEIGLHYYPMKLTRDPETLAAIYKEDTSQW